MKASACLRFGSLFLFFAVAFGAFGAHALKARLDPYDLAIWNTAVLYQLVHGLGLLIIAILHSRDLCPRRLGASALFMCLGVTLFSGSLYALVISQLRFLGAVTPFGGVCFLVAWLLLLSATWTKTKSS